MMQIRTFEFIYNFNHIPVSRALCFSPIEVFCFTLQTLINSIFVQPEQFPSQITGGISVLQISIAIRTFA